MTVEELIKELSKFEGDKMVFVPMPMPDGDCTCSGTANNIEIDKDGDIVIRCL